MVQLKQIVSATAEYRTYGSSVQILYKFEILNSTGKIHVNLLKLQIYKSPLLRWKRKNIH